MFPITTKTHFTNNFITWKLVSTLNSGQRQVMIKGCEGMQKLNYVSWIAPNYGIYVLYTFISLYHDLMLTRLQGRN